MGGKEVPMPSQKQQFNVRLDAVAAQLAEELPAVLERERGMVPSQADMIRAALIALAKELGHPVPVPKPAEVKPAKPRKKKPT
jgi:hypothetical protein